MAINKYLYTGLCYGFIRKTFYVTTQNPQIGISNEYDTKLNKSIEVNRDMLVTEKITTVCFNTGLNAFYWPIYIFKDLTSIEIYLKNIKKTKQSYYDNNIFYHSTI